MCGPVLCHSNQGTPVLQSQSETELMADAVLKCIQVLHFAVLLVPDANLQLHFWQDNVEMIACVVS